MQQGREVLLGVPLTCSARDDLECLRNCLELPRPEGLARHKIGRLLLAHRNRVAEVLLVRVPRAHGVLEVPPCVRLHLQSLGLLRRLINPVVRRIVDQALELVCQELEGGHCLHLSLLQSGAHVHELVEELL